MNNSNTIKFIFPILCDFTILPAYGLIWIEA
jgi:hypothetical protein